MAGTNPGKVPALVESDADVPLGGEALYRKRTDRFGLADMRDNLSSGVVVFVTVGIDFDPDGRVVAGFIFPKGADPRKALQLALTTTGFLVSIVSTVRAVAAPLDVGGCVDALIVVVALASSDFGPVGGGFGSILADGLIPKGLEIVG